MKRIDKKAKRIKRLKEFVVLKYSGPIHLRFINDDEGGMERIMMRSEDLCVLLKDWFIEFRYNGIGYRLEVQEGAIWDEASVPLLVRFGNGTAHNRYVRIPALVHDCLFALHLMPVDEANDVFSALLKWNGLNWFTRARLVLGVRSFIGKRLYKKSNPETHWLKPYVHWYEDI